MTTDQKLTFGERFGHWKGPIFWLIVGLVVGPLVSSLAGWQVSGKTARRNVQNAIVKQQAAMCEMRANDHVKNLAQLNFGQKSAVAQKYAQFPWSKKVRQAVVDRCTNAIADETNTKTSSTAKTAGPAAVHHS